MVDKPLIGVLLLYLLGSTVCSACGGAMAGAGYSSLASGAVDPLAVRQSMGIIPYEMLTEKSSK